MMTGSNYLCDTNIVAAYFNREPAIREKLAGITVYVPGIVIGVYFGAYKSQRVIFMAEARRNFGLKAILFLKMISGLRLLPCNMI
jgi:predicted nucleic acid-binding protein